MGGRDIHRSTTGEDRRRSPPRSSRRGDVAVSSRTRNDRLDRRRVNGSVSPRRSTGRRVDDKHDKPSTTRSSQHERSDRDRCDRNRNHLNGDRSSSRQSQPSSNFSEKPYRDREKERLANGDNSRKVSISDKSTRDRDEKRHSNGDRGRRPSPSGSSPRKASVISTNITSTISRDKEPKESEKTSEKPSHSRRQTAEDDVDDRGRKRSRPDLGHNRSSPPKKPRRDENSRSPLKPRSFQRQSENQFDRRRSYNHNEPHRENRDRSRPSMSTLFNRSRRDTSEEKQRHVFRNQGSLDNRRSRSRAIADLRHGFSSSAMGKRLQHDKTDSVAVVNMENDSSDDSSSSNDDLDDLNVDKWVRSAPEELYYIRNNSGDFLATDAAKKLCRKFERKLLIKAQTARMEAERVGAANLEELVEKEKLELQKQAELKKLKREGGKCSHSCSSRSEENSENPDAGGIDSVEKEIVEAIADAKPQEHEITITECDKHEEGEICDCIQIQSQSQSSSTTAEVKASKNFDYKPPEQEPLERKSACKPGEKQPEKSFGNKTATPCDSKISKAGKSETNRKDNNIENTNQNCTDKSCKTSRSRSTSKTAKTKTPCCKKTSGSDSSDDSDSDSSDEECGISRSDAANRELEKKKLHPRRLHLELWHNDPGLMNDGPLCRCSAKARRFGIRHGYYPGEESVPACDPFSTNKEKLVHYRITISPPKNFLVKTPTVINHDGHEYIFEGFSLLSHHKVDLNLPPCKVIRFNIRYDIFVAEEKFPESFCVQELDMFETYLFREVLELLDLKYDWKEGNSCPPFHLMPRFVRQLPDNGKEILSMNRVLLHLLKSDKDIIQEEELSNFFTIKQAEWQNFADKHKGMIVTKFGQKPCALRVDQIDRDISGQEIDATEGIPYPLLVHFGIRPPQLSYAGNTNYQRAWRRYVKYRHLLSNMAKPSAEEKRKLASKELKLQEMRTASSMKRDVTVAVSARGFRTTGIFCDLVQHAMLIPVLVAHLRFHKALSTLETRMEYQFSNRFLLQLAMTHPSYRENFGTNPDHARNALTNCGIRQPEYGDRRIHYASTRKRGINTLINIMAKFGSDREMESEITHNERLEFLGDAVVEFVTSIHLFHMFPNLEEGGLATYRAAIVQNQHLAVLAQRLGLDEYMLYAHGSDLCHDSELRHAMANCFEALMGALFLDGGIQISDTVFATTLFLNEADIHKLWEKYPRHPLQTEEPEGDRHWVSTHTVLQKLTQFEESIGVEFTHIRLLARAFTDRSLGYNNLSKGSNQRLEFLGDTVLQLISSEYLYRHFPDHHEGHLSLLRSSLVNNRTQALVCDDLGMTQYAMRGDPKSEMKTKDRADLLEAVLGALYIDKGLEHCITFCSVCFFPRLNKSIIKQEWNDPKSKLQQCCLTLRAMDGKEPDIPVYKVTQSLGPTNTRIYIVAVYFRGERLATAQGHSIQEAEMNAAALALEQSGHLFPQLHHQRSVLDKTTKRQKRYH